jgi:hypothetical protein
MPPLAEMVRGSGFFGLHRSSPYLPLPPGQRGSAPPFWIWRPSFERQRDFNPHEQRAAQRALPYSHTSRMCRRERRTGLPRRDHTVIFVPSNLVNVKPSKGSLNVLR